MSPNVNVTSCNFFFPLSALLRNWSKKNQKREKSNPGCFEQKDRLSPECGDIPQLTYDDTTPLPPPPGKSCKGPNGS